MPWKYNIDVWCNGSTADFESVSDGSTPSISASKENFRRTTDGHYLFTTESILSCMFGYIYWICFFYFVRHIQFMDVWYFRLEEKYLFSFSLFFTLVYTCIWSNDIV